MRRFWLGLMVAVLVAAGIPAQGHEVVKEDWDWAAAMLEVAKSGKAKGVKTSEITALILDRPRHADLIASVRKAGAGVRLITDGDVAGVIFTTMPDETGVDIYLGTGAAPEGVLAASALRCIGGQMQGRLVLDTDEKRARAAGMGVQDPNKKYGLHDLANGNVMFAATGVTDGAMLKGVRRYSGGASTHSIVMRSKTGTVHVIETQHNFDRKTWYGVYV